MKKSTRTPNPVRIEEINRRIDELFDQKDPKRYQRTRETLQAIFRRGLDFSQGIPVHQVMSHLASRLDKGLNSFYDQHPEVKKEGKALTDAIHRLGEQFLGVDPPSSHDPNSSSKRDN